MLRELTFLFFVSLLTACNTGTTAEKKGQQKDVLSTELADQIAPVPYTEKYDTGQLKVLGQKVNGEKVGKWQSYYPDGKVWSEGEYYEGEKNGKFKDYYNSGMLRYKGAYVNDLKQGPWYFYDETGKVDKKVTYQRGEIVKDK